MSFFSLWGYMPESSFILILPIVFITIVCSWPLSKIKPISIRIIYTIFTPVVIAFAWFCILMVVEINFSTNPNSDQYDYFLILFVFGMSFSGIFSGLTSVFIFSFIRHHQALKHKLK